MGRATILFGSTAPVGPDSPEAAAFEYLHTRATAGQWAPRPPVERWREDQRRRFFTELERLEDERKRQAEEAAAVWRTT